MSEPKDREVLRVNPDAESVEVAGEVVVVSAGRVHQLNPSAAEIWRACDGATPVGAIVEQFAARFGIDPSMMRSDVTSALAELTRQLLVVPVDPAPTAVPTVEPVALCASCGPGPRYARHVLVDLGDRRAAVGCDEHLAPALLAAFGSRGIDIDIDPDGRPSYGLVLERSGPGPLRQLHRLHRGPDLLVAHRDAERPVRALVTLLSRHARRREAYLDALAIGDETGVALIRPPGQPGALARAVETRGFSIDDGVSVAVLDDGTVRLGPHPDDDIDWSEVRSALPAPVTRSTVAAPLGWGPVRVSDVVVHGTADAIGAFAELGPSLGEEPGPLEPLRAFFDAVRITSGREETVLDVLARRRAGGRSTG